MIAKHWQLFECKSPKVKLVHSGELICVGDGKAPVDIRATVEDIQEGSPLKTVKISRPKVIEKDARALRLF